MRHICKIEKLEIRAVIKCFCKKGMPSKGIHKDFMETLWKEHCQENGQKSLRGGGGGGESVEDDV